jgi:hypothetical protein
LTGTIVYQSLTQLLIRRSLFILTGYFESRWGSIGDINWDMKAGLVANTIHVPDTWASYRVHATQATAEVNFRSCEYSARVEEMIADAIDKCGRYLDPAMLEGITAEWLDRAKEIRSYYAELRIRPSLLERRLFQAGLLLRGTPAARGELLGRLRGRPRWPSIAATEIRTWLESRGLGPAIIPL